MMIILYRWLSVVKALARMSEVSDDTAVCLDTHTVVEDFVLASFFYAEENTNCSTTPSTYYVCSSWQCCPLLLHRHGWSIYWGCRQTANRPLPEALSPSVGVRVVVSVQLHPRSPSPSSQSQNKARPEQTKGRYRAGNIITSKSW